MVNKPLRLTRDQIARIVGNDQDAIRQFERLFAVGEVSETGTPALEALVAQVATAPSDPWLERVNVETIDWRRFPRYVPQEGRMGWEPLYGTLAAGMAGNVMARFGQSLFVPVVNGTGATLPVGAVVHMTGAASGEALTVAPFIADGSIAAERVLGIVPVAIPAGASGFACGYGPVVGFDTSSFAAGALLYASGTVAGAMVTSPPALSVFMGAVTLVSSTQGRMTVLNRR
jgi:hypothetical protein